MGPGKTGTSWLYEFVQRRGLASVPALKEPYLVDKSAEEAARLVRTLYTSYERMCDFSNTYSNNPKNPHRILAHNPEAKVIITSRMPSERIASHYAFEVRSGAPDVGLATYLDSGDPIGMIPRSNYRAILDRYLAQFPHNHVLLLPLEQLESEPETYVKRMTDFLGVPPIELPEEDLAPVRVRARPRSRIIARTAARGGRWMRKRGLARTLGALKRSQAMARILYRRDKTQARPHFGASQARVTALDTDYRSLVEEHAGFRLT